VLARSDYLMFGSLTFRLITAATVVLSLCLALTGMALDDIYRTDALALTQQRLQAQLYAVLGAAATDDDGRISAFEAPPDPRFVTPDSGLYARVLDGQGVVIWRSNSWLNGKSIMFPETSVTPEAQALDLMSAKGEALFGTAWAFEWEDVNGVSERYVVQVAEQRAGFDRRVAGFRASLTFSFAVAIGVLIVIQGLVLTWGLSPLRKVAREVAQIQTGDRMRLGGRYPTELRPLASALNALIEMSERRLERYRHGLADLAHSLKTPLAVMRGATRLGEGDLRDAVREQVDRMDRAVGYQLQRASTTGGTVIGPPIAVDAKLISVANSLRKVYVDRELSLGVHASADLMFRIDEGDLLELAGNLMDNACKFARTTVVTTARLESDGALIIAVEDDGPGIESALVSTLLQRGARADPDVAGQGIGLAVVVQLVMEGHGGALDISKSVALGGASVVATLPAMSPS
jgi:two-component system, OmpR family, sensor histidine kinase PhoQ